MVDEIFQKPFVVVAHRGGGQEVAENTVKGIMHALRIGAEAIEVDLRTTSDGRIILLHDEDFERVAGIQKKPGDLELAYIKENILIFDQEPVATLEEALEAVAGKAVLFLEIKEEGIAKRVVELVGSADAKEWVVLISFLESVIYEVKKLDSSIKTGLVYNRPPGKILEAKDLGADFVLPRYNLSTYKAISFAHSLGLRVVGWTINDKEILAQLLHDGCDAIATDYPKEFVHLRKRLFSNESLSVMQKRLKLRLEDGSFLYDLVADKKSLKEVAKESELYKKLRKRCPKVVLFQDGNKYHIEGEVSERELKELLDGGGRD